MTYHTPPQSIRVALKRVHFLRLVGAFFPLRVFLRKVDEIAAKNKPQEPDV